MGKPKLDENLEDELEEEEDEDGIPDEEPEDEDERKDRLRREQEEKIWSSSGRHNDDDDADLHDGNGFERYQEDINRLRRAIKEGRFAEAKKLYAQRIHDTNALVDVVAGLVREATRGSKIDAKLLKNAVGVVRGKTRIAVVSQAVLAHEIGDVMSLGEKKLPNRHEDHEEDGEDDVDYGDSKPDGKGDASDKVLAHLKRKLLVRGAVNVDNVVFKNNASREDTMNSLRALALVPFARIEKAVKYADVQLASDIFFIHPTKGPSLRIFALQAAQDVLPDDIEDWSSVPRENTWAFYAMYLFGGNKSRSKRREAIRKYLRQEQKSTLADALKGVAGRH